MKAKEYLSQLLAGAAKDWAHRIAFEWLLLAINEDAVLSQEQQKFVFDVLVEKRREQSLELLPIATYINTCKG
jgi:hypothetical protein